MPKQYNQSFVLPDDDEPAATVAVIVARSGKLFLSHPQDMPFLDAIGILSGGIQVAAMNAKKQIVQAAQEDSKIVRPDFGLKKIVDSTR